MKCKLRKCLYTPYYGKEKSIKGYFHTWGQVSDEDGAIVVAVIEKEDGNIIQTDCENVQFKEWDDKNE